MYWTELLVLFHFCLSVTIALRVIYSRRTSSAALAWLTALFAFPILGVITYLLIGEPKLGRERAKRSAELRNFHSAFVERFLPPPGEPNCETRFRQIARLLSPRGRFINADQVLGETAAAERIYTEAWRQHVMHNIALTEAGKNAAFERIKLDRMATLSDQFQWLTTAGLPPTLYFQHYNFVVFAADKPQD